MIDLLNDLWVAEYSEQQKQFNVTTLRSAIESNASMVISGQQNDYLIFDICKTIDEADKACDLMQEAQKQGQNSFLDTQNVMGEGPVQP